MASVVSSTNGASEAGDEAGFDLSKLATVKLQGCPTAMEWGPAPHYFLVVGLATGAVVSIWDGERGKESDKTAVHQSRVNFVRWSPDGTKVLTGDDKGVVCVWKPEARTAGRTNPVLTPSLQHKRDGAATHCCLRVKMLPSGIEEIPTGCPPFFFAGESGIVSWANDQGTCRTVTDQKSPISVLLHNSTHDQLVVITRSLVMSVWEFGEDGRGSQVGMDVKLSASGADAGQKLRACWLDAGVLATVAGENVVRVWDLRNDDNYVLSLHDQDAVTDGDRITCVDFIPTSGVLSCGTQMGSVVLWKKSNGAMGSAAWSVLAPVGLGSTVISVQWSQHHGSLAAVGAEGAGMLVECEAVRRVKGGASIVQTGADRLTVQCDVSSSSEAVDLECGMLLRGGDVTADHVLVWSGQKATVFDIKDGRSSELASFESRARTMAMSGQQLYIPQGNGKIGVANLHGTVGSTMTLQTQEGEPLLLDACGNWLLCVTTEQVIKIWKISKAEPTEFVTGRRFEEIGQRNLRPMSVRINGDGTRVSLLCRRLETSTGRWLMDSSLYVFDTESDMIYTHDFGDRVPVSHYWDPIDPRLIACETHLKKAPANNGQASDLELAAIPTDVTLLFTTPDQGLKAQDSFAISSSDECLVGSQVPNVYIGKASPSHGILLQPHTMRDFIGIDNLDLPTRNALLDFSYKLTIGNMDEAYKAVKLVKSSSVWVNMATMCVKTKRMDVAEVCLGNMGNARGARCVRLARNEPELEARVAMVALQLGKVEDAERLYIECGRYDLLNNMYQATGQWKKAQEVAEKKDRMHLRTTRFVEARHYEGCGDVNAAINAYEGAEANNTEVPRMLWESGNIDRLEQYVKQKNDPKLWQWWARYMESQGELVNAVSFYEKAEDNLSIVRVLCFQGDFEGALRRVSDTNDPLAAYHLATQFENHGKVQEAVELFAQSGRFNHAARLAKEAGMENKLLALALQSPARVQVETAEFFEEKGMMDKAVLLYQKAGSVSKALDLCFSAKLFDSLRAMADDLSSDTDPTLLAKVGNFFMSNNQFEKAVQLLFTAKQWDRGLDMCLQHSVKITEEMAEKITDQLPSKEEDEKRRIAVLHKIAKVAKKQGSFHLATKKFTQAGLKMKAMKSLLRSGDTEKIIFFAGVLKQPDIYVMAANYLQTLDWHNEPEIMKAIQNFYTKAKAYFSLATFFEACSQVEIDEYRDYEKALGALKEALKFCAKAIAKTPEAQRKHDDLEQRVHYVEAFVAGRKLAMSDPNEMIKVCYQLLEQPDIESAIRVGDVFALLIEWYFTQGDFPQAYQLTKQMKERNIVLGPYLDSAMVEKIYQQCGVQTQAVDDDGIDEEIVED